MKKILIVVGTRPNFIKITRFKAENEKMGSPFDIKIVHTGQHYDDKMANVFFDQFRLAPDFFLNIPNASPNTQMAEIMLRLEQVINQQKPDLVLVPGDVNSTFAAALTCNKMGIKIGHIESGLRSFDRTMPEEFNRILTDEVADYYFVTEPSGKSHLQNEGKLTERIFFVGNTMIDTLVAYHEEINSSDIIDRLGLTAKQYVLMTMHRPATVDQTEGLTKLFDAIRIITDRFKVVFPIHPRTIQNIRHLGMETEMKQIQGLLITEPQDYFAFQKLISCCKFVLTDSGGIQEETTFLQIPCLTLRPNTERPVTVDTGTNELIPFDTEIIQMKMKAIAEEKFKKGNIPEKWDGMATHRILEHCLQLLVSEKKENTTIR
ncbi:MAG: UDP-N-acetylglucosamine 2-epimerase (non-hydrolyzing) [Bacteroidia bacterium]|nr:UDP-N-acetylglucosamine 2-epimerase (non-hydrolyzing) [Bacteroidia bacterium]MCZ2278085.1 UDP-N-acetylglucosamine 2-epimerase (non-hydrolyzing) [Bacteroidia bacterium]